MRGDRDKLYEHRYKYLYALADYVHFVTRSWRPTYGGGGQVDKREYLWFDVQIDEK